MVFVSSFARERRSTRDRQMGRSRDATSGSETHVCSNRSVTVRHASLYVDRLDFLRCFLTQDVQRVVVRRVDVGLVRRDRDLDFAFLRGGRRSEIVRNFLLGTVAPGNLERDRNGTSDIESCGGARIAQKRGRGRTSCTLQNE